MVSTDLVLALGSDDVVQIPDRVQLRVVPRGIHLDVVGVDRLGTFVEDELPDLWDRFDRVVVDSVLTPYRSTWYGGGGYRPEARAWWAKQPKSLFGSALCHCPGGSFSTGFWTEESKYNHKVDYQKGDLVVTAGNDLNVADDDDGLLDVLSEARVAGASVLYLRGFRRGWWQRDPERGDEWC